jgi:ribonucleoside-diphosphate reductase alpha chain
MAEPSGKKLDDMYKLAWLKGLKTTYYLRTTSATSAEKSTIGTNALNAVAGAVGTAPSKATVTNLSAQFGTTAASAPQAGPDLSNVKACLITDPECEACQ